MPHALDDTDDDIPAAIDFSGGTRGRFYPEDALRRDAPPSEPAETTLDAVLEEFSGALRERLGSRFAGLWLYGSQARADAGPDSDIDVLLLLHEMQRPGKEIDAIADILADLNLRHGVLLSVLPIAERDLPQLAGPFWRNVRREGRSV